MTLVKEIDGGDGLDGDVFIKVYKEFFSYVYRYLYGLTYSQQTAEDLTQEAFIKALCILQFPNENIKSWLLTVAHNLYVDYVRKNSRLDFGDNSLFSQVSVQDFTGELILKETTKSAFELIKKLPENQRQAVLLCLINELSYQQAAEVLGISVSAVTNLIYRARKTLRALRRCINE
jgi:RNA polymerase sigma-70 factor (ECF subfamily)